ncbi:efflux RND transporter permease subunit [Vibrio crassostreae]|uniref:efflux RND transporter permease subunit n=1 Tax=Vibrio crassostreae TaxID=246167 RepID=UPI000F47BC87|nr:efflux RND transporter permease subunit [Vibrio crassostreae]NOH77632.1 efflux RND transporter permease subunit [Vibrio crassostreae]NOI51915.1 efflux RND transporter permease subunit [Vibrio crassostreae]ROR05348.1 multidrug efflux pump subunit AcrB [Vibrio crassostreae]CAK2020652.1 Efflux RND transporter permease subunit [Vibrio crassostreae]CAK2331716.1 Efflux RND transporter permease subunit [Vibrio crassostreae]
MSWMTKWFINNPVAANLLMMAIVISGVLAFGQLRVESFPQIAPSSISITVAYPGGTAQQIDESVTQRIEESISGIAGIKQITSQSSAGMSRVVVRKTSSADLDKLLDDIRNQVNAINGFPVQAERPQVVRNEFTNLAAFVVVSGPRADDELQPIAKQLEQALKKNPQISKVSNWGDRTPQLVIEPDPDQLKALGLSLEGLASLVEQRSLETRSGELISDKGRMVIRGDGYADDLQKLNQLVVISGSNGKIHLGDIAKLTRGYQYSGSIVRNNGANAIALLVSTSQTDNLLKVSEAISETLDAQRAILPSDIELNTMADMAPYIEEQLFRLSENAWQGLLIVLILLGIFLEVRLAFWVAMGIPIALTGTLAAMQWFNYSINDITLFGFILVLGVLVDDAVVVGEAIHEKRTGNGSNSGNLNINGPSNINGKTAAWQGVHSVSVATVFGVLTTIAAFSPMLWINNELAKVLAGFSAVVIFALIFSLIESKFILPSHLAQLSVKKPSTSIFAKVQNAAQGGLQWFNLNIYKPVLEFALSYKVASLLGFVAVISLAYGMWSNGAIRSALFPEIPGRYITAVIELEDGAPLPLQRQALLQVEQAMTQVEKGLMEDYPLQEKPVVNLLAWSDGYGEIEVTAELTNESLSLLPGNLLLKRWRESAGQIEGAYSVKFSAAEEPAGGTFLTISSNDRELASRVSEQLADSLASLKGVSDVYDDGQDGLPQVRLVLNPYGQQLGLTQATLAQLAGEAFGEREVHRLLENGQETKVLLQYPRDERRTLAQLQQALIMLPNGGSVMMGDIAEFRHEQEPQVVYRRDREQVINLYWKQHRALQSPEKTREQLEDTIESLHLQYPSVTIKAGGEFEEIGEVSDGFESAMILTLLMIYILLAVPLKSYWQPMIIMAVIPFGFAGAIFGHYLMDLPISILSMFGMMAMTGIVINDSLVLITRFNAEYRQGVPLQQALVIAGTSRLRAIFLTTITTVCGLLPLLSETAEQAQYLKPAAVSLVFGELFATAVTLILIPVLLGLFCCKPPQVENLIAQEPREQDALEELSLERS